MGVGAGVGLAVGVGVAVGIGVTVAVSTVVGSGIGAGIGDGAGAGNSVGVGERAAPRAWAGVGVDSGWGSGVGVGMGIGVVRDAGVTNLTTSSLAAGPRRAGGGGASFGRIAGTGWGVASWVSGGIGAGPAVGTETVRLGVMGTIDVGVALICCVCGGRVTGANCTVGVAGYSGDGGVEVPLHAATAIPRQIQLQRNRPCLSCNWSLGVSNPTGAPFALGSSGVWFKAALPFWDTQWGAS